MREREPNGRDDAAEDRRETVSSRAPHDASPEPRTPRPLLRIAKLGSEHHEAGGH